MITFCASPDDEHAPFPHRLVTTRKSCYVVCAECDHLVGRDVPSCPCSRGCHPDSWQRVAAIVESLLE